MKWLISVLLVLSAVISTQAVDLPNLRTLHNECSQNLVCLDGLYCRRYNGAVYGTCEQP
ncbi:hypothetical protein PHYBLDRAFT_139434 [Phycomyces blakesleeanus NRRL 1555(-)]|uniref:Uncharacterized protein n=1 Tax=Phycomyces blakesleeanus (strain ATCC 8743b / DSM 1359 / FGSC 10004 / NBRC 33097 / NRRL 1555) TaxID=763407 RepID=A0A162V1Q0_PHYB8|nr:hypothetical protein PHYBLDRAFT_139434 [Phycomyces blakesleeanus NRRL 1555(-)]OAD79403.1 hypothetical protein PHYBLDRAFT_139434 [Phycomyces blakesleeanus NRRL 1555(-)]|eukprot:XP_018297443.1 hypothetical protein PHYBLDRAFT_139434 [Phycomyces blakesleeanus NRRL 1555(-)]